MTTKGEQARKFIDPFSYYKALCKELDRQSKRKSIYDDKNVSRIMTFRGYIIRFDENYWYKMTKKSMQRRNKMQQ